MRLWQGIQPIIFIVIFSIVFGLESYALISNKIPLDYNMYVSLVLLVPFIFIWALKSKVNISDRTSNLLRDMSLWIYCIHELIMMLIFSYTKLLGSNTLINFIVVTSFSITIAYFIARKRVKPEAIYIKEELKFAIGTLVVGILFIFANAQGNSAGTVGNNPNEINIADDAPSSNIVGNLWRISEGDSLDKHITSEAMEIMKRRVEELGVAIDKVKGFRAVYNASRYLQKNLESDKNSVVYGVNSYLDYRGEKEGKSIIGMYDTYEFYKDVFNVPNDVEDAYVKLMQYFAGVSEKYSEGLEAWKLGDTEKVLDCLENPYSVAEEEKENLNNLIAIVNKYNGDTLTKQNKVYSLKIDEYMKENKNYFIYISVDSILGENGLAKMLENKGYKVERVTK